MLALDWRGGLIEGGSCMKINLCNSNQVTCKSMAEVKHISYIKGSYYRFEWLFIWWRWKDKRCNMRTLLQFICKNETGAINTICGYCWRLYSLKIECKFHCNKKGYRLNFDINIIRLNNYITTLWQKILQELQNKQVTLLVFANLMNERCYRYYM